MPPWELAELLAQRGDLDGLRARADAGDREAAGKLATGCWPIAATWTGCAPSPTPGTGMPLGDWPNCWPSAATWRGCAPGPTPATGMPPGGWPSCWASAVTWRGCAPGPTPATGMPPGELADLLVERGDLEGLRARADAGRHGDLSCWPAELLAGTGRSAGRAR